MRLSTALRMSSALLTEATSLRIQQPRNKPFPVLPGHRGDLEKKEALKHLKEYSKAVQTPTSLRTLFEFGSNPTAARIMLGAQFLHRELPIRFAHRAQELANLPYGLSKMPSIRRVRRMYEHSYCEVLRCRRPINVDDENRFADLLMSMLHKHEDVVKLIARGVLELRILHGANTNDVRIQSFLDRFYMSRIGIQMLISQQIAIRDYRPGYVGIINSKCSPSEVSLDAAEAVRSLAYRHYGDAPEIIVKGDTKLTLPYVDGHLFFPLFELLKNSVRATVERHENSDSMPPVRVMIAAGSEDVTIKVSDEGGGIRRSVMDRIWTYLYSTAAVTAQELLQVDGDRIVEMRAQEEDNSSDEDDEFGEDSRAGLDPIAGFGYGLPLSRLYARYFGGDLTIISMEGYGTDAYLGLCKLGDREEIVH